MDERLSILLVEDNLLNQRIVTFSLKRFNHEVTIANHGVEAIEKFCEKKFDVILMDIMMPVMDGIEATIKIREIDPDVPIIAQTAYAMSEDKNKCLNAGCNDYLTKPINHRLLLSAIEKYITSSYPLHSGE